MPTTFPIIQYPANTAQYAVGRACGAGAIKGIVLIPTYKDIAQILADAKTTPVNQVTPGCWGGVHFAYDVLTNKLYQFISIANTAYTFSLTDTDCDFAAGTPLLVGEAGGVSPNCTAVSVAISYPVNKVFGTAGDGELTAIQLANLRCALSAILQAVQVLTAGMADANFWLWGSTFGETAAGDKGEILGTAIATVLAAVCTLPEYPNVRGAEIVAAARTLTVADNGKIFFLDHATEFPITLPALTQGLNFKFIVKNAPEAANFTIISAGSVNNILGQVLSGDLDAAGDADSEVTGADTISFVAAKAVIGDRVDVICDGVNWLAYGFCKAFDAIIITTAS